MVGCWCLYTFHGLRLWFAYWIARCEQLRPVHRNNLLRLAFPSKWDQVWSSTVSRSPADEVSTCLIAYDHLAFPERWSYDGCALSSSSRWRCQPGQAWQNDSTVHSLPEPPHWRLQTVAGCTSRSECAKHEWRFTPFYQLSEPWSWYCHDICPN